MAILKDNGVPLRLAVICISCEYIRPVSEAVCPRCASHSAWLLSKWLSGKKMRG